ncbi:MAG TPA: DUF2381 family protein [Myxococcaceae bacterium]|nr:DUF2381 family protein [Myxococcaceae bacterium]
MLFSPSSAFLALALLAEPPAAVEPPALLSCRAGVLHLELTADATGEPVEVCIRPGLTTTFLVDSKRVRVELKERERFFRVAEIAGMLVLIPSESLRDGERLRVTFHFEDGAAPTSVTFVLVVHPAQAAWQVEVSRHPRPVASYRQEARQARAEALQCQQEKARLQAECSGRTGLTGLVAPGLVDGRGVLSRDIQEEVVLRPEELLIPTSAHSYRSTTLHMKGEEQLVRLAVRLDLRNRGTEPWLVAGAALIGPTGEQLRILDFWQLDTAPPGQWSPVVVEAEATERQARGPFLLKLWDADGQRVITIGNVTFPE